ncbi:MAG: hypothetical protein J0L75_04945 [Spirochaetes bacterium]|nr:hypothetical protein [Spirochaetota bacterium]
MRLRLALFGLLPLFYLVFPQKTNVVVTHIDFENRSMAGWGAEGDASTFTWSLDEERPHGGQVSARFEVTGKALGARRRHLWVGFPKGMEVARITVRFFLRTRNLQPGDLTFNMLERNASGVLGWAQGKNPFLTPTCCESWTLIEASGDLTKGLTGVTLYWSVLRKGLEQGAFWIDDLSVEVLPAAPTITFHSGERGHLISKIQGHMRVTFPDASNLSGGRVLVSDEYGKTIDSITVPSGASVAGVALPGRGYYHLNASGVYPSGRLTGQTGAAVLGPPPSEDLRLSSRLGFFSVRDLPEAAIKVGTGWNRKFLSWNISRKNGALVYTGPSNLLQMPTNQNWILCFDGLPDWMSSPPSGSGMIPGKFYAPTDWDELRRAVRLILDRPRTIRFLEVMNEPDGNWKGTAAELVKYHRVIAEAAHSIDPTLRVLGPCPYSIRLPDLDAWVRLGMLDPLDGLAIHAYVNGTPPEVEFIEKIVGLKTYLSSIGRASLPIYFTEFGWTTAEGTWQKPVDELTQARYLARSLGLCSAQGIDALCYFCLLYHPAPNPGELNFSVLRSDETPKPSFAAYANLTRRLAGCERGGRWWRLSPESHLLVFRRGATAVAMAWDTSTNTEVGSPTGLTELADMMGRPLPFKGPQLSIGPSPVYFELPDSNFIDPVVLPSVTLLLGRSLPCALSDLVGVPTLSVEGGMLKASTQAHPGSYLVLGRSGGTWKAQPVVLHSPLEIEGCYLEWPSTATPRLAVALRSGFEAPLQVKVRAACENARDLFGGPYSLSNQDRLKVALPLDTFRHGQRYFGKLFADALYGSVFQQGSAPFDFTLLPCLPGELTEATSFMDISSWDPFGDELVDGRLQRGDCAAQIRFTYDDAGLHVAAFVQDDTHLQSWTAAEMWKGDSLQLAFDLDRDSPWLPNSGRYFNGHRVFEYGLAKGESGVMNWRWVSYSDLPTSVSEKRMATTVIREGTVTRYEINFPWVTLGLERRPTPGRTFGIAVAVNDLDANGGKRHGLRLFHGIVEAKDPTRFGALNFR